MGLTGSVLVTVAGPSRTGAGASWWFRISVPEVLLYLGIVLLVLAWLGIGRITSRLPLGMLRAVGAVWCVPLLAGPPLFSHDAYSYLAQGTILHLGRDPYHTTPAVLAGLARRQLLAAVSPFWRHTTAPYGPLFLGLASLVVAATGSHLIAGVLLLRALELAGAVLLAIFVPRLASALGADPGRALWLAVVSPLVLLQLIGPAHNDALMAGLMAAGVACAVRRRPALGIALCALAATIKLPAAVAALFIAVVWARSMPDRRGSAIVFGRSIAIAALLLVIVTLVVGVGADWVSTAVFSTPERVRLAITPATAIGRTVADLLHAAGIAVDGRSLEATLATVVFALTVAAGAIVLWRTRAQTMVRNLGLLLLAAALAGPAAWPWYLSWGLVLVAACPGLQRSRALVLAVAVSVFLVKPDGILALPLATAPAVLAVYALGGWTLWRSSSGRPGGRRRIATASALAQPR